MASPTVKKRKRPSPFRIRVGCVVALRYKPVTGNHVTMIVPPVLGDPQQTKPSKHALYCLAGNDSHVEVWTDPIPGRDEGLALIGRRVRCCFAREMKSDGKAVNGAEERSKKTKKIIIEGEVVSILDYGKLRCRQCEAKSRGSRRAEHCGIYVELLIDRDLLGTCPFLERTDEDVKIDDIRKESARRAYRNEEAIKGKNKVTVEVLLEDSSGIVCDSEETNSAHQAGNVAKWAIRKRIPNEPGKLFDSDNNGTKNDANGAKYCESPGSTGQQGTADQLTKGEGKASGETRAFGLGADEHREGSENANDPQKKKRKSNGSKKATTAPTQYMGNKNDDAAQQQRNWRWFSARFYDLYLAETTGSRDPVSSIWNGNTFDFLEYYSELLPCCGGLFGEVLEVAPSSRAGTLAMVTIRRLILPEQLASGRSTVYDPQKCGPWHAFDDYDSTLIGRRKKTGEDVSRSKPDTTSDDSLTSVLFKVPIEELVIVSRHVKRFSQNQPVELDMTSECNMDKDLLIECSYSWQANCLVPMKNMLPKGSEGKALILRPLNKKKLKKLSLCHRCRTWLPKKQVTICENENCILQQQLCSANEENGEYNPESVGWCDSCLLRVKGLASILDNDFSMDADQLLDMPCCKKLCDCRHCHTLVDQVQANDEFLGALDTARTTKSKRYPSDMAGETDSDVGLGSSVFRDAESMVKSAPYCSFDIPANFIDLKSLPISGSKPITKIKPPTKKGPNSEKRKRDTSLNKKSNKKSKTSSSRPGTPTPPSGGTHRTARRTSEDYSMFKPTCARFMDYDVARKTKAIRKADDEERMTSGKLASNDKVRNMREVMEKQSSLETEKKTEKEEKSLSSRAARANQRRLVKDVARLGASSVNLDTLSGRESQMRFDRSGIHGWGVFADVEISAGDMIIEYRGELIGNAMAEKREREYEAAKIGSDYMFRIDGLTVCDATKQGNVARFINASCDPNCHTKIITLDGKQRIVIYAKKDIKVGEELCYDYKFSLELDESKRIPCCCGSPECRGFMNWDKKLG